MESVEGALLPLRRVRGGATVSRQAIAAVIAREDLSSGERLVAFSLASFADRGNCARAGTLAAAGRAGLGRSRFLEARDGLVHLGLLVVERAATGRGRASTLALPFADAGPWWEGDINAELFEAVLGYSRAQGPARLLVAAMAALADERGLIERLTPSSCASRPGSWTARMGGSGGRCSPRGSWCFAARRAAGGTPTAGRFPTPGRAGPPSAGRGGVWRRRRGCVRWLPRSPRRPTRTSPARCRSRSSSRRRGCRPAAKRAVRIEQFRRRTVRSCQGFLVQKAVRTGQFRPRTVRG